ncbi:hypothetical protein L210DRAFT_3715673 [Boletus edulis BED1]|uniref:Polynucleotide 5'-hydroxyl-kinase GRC3 n=1 Tax=Boletus edulis BED1 TaxID=1328754 RepID=A0AAD4GIZ6_BOLED|nr:hypothetical protein L210DRAFT_3715673 [Boletus edulis BED1]
MSDNKEWHLHPETEYRFELDPGTSLVIKLQRGHAEIFGAELAEGKSYLFGSECKAAVFTWHGCTIQMSRSLSYVSDETPMSTYANVHFVFEQMRVRALRDLHGSPPSDDDPPRVLILGPENSGKTSISKILTNYTVRAAQNWSPLLVNLDPAQGAWTIPGTISAAVVRSPIGTASPANPLGSAATSAPTALASNALIPLTYWYGNPDTKSNPQLLDRLVRNLGVHVIERHDMDPQARVSGLIIDTPSSFASGPSSGSSADSRHTLIKACVDAFHINVILVVGHEKLNAEMQRLYGTQLTVVKIPKSGGVVELDHAYRERVHSYQLHAYMYGQKIDPPPGVSSGLVGGEAATELILSPSSTIINLGDLTIYRVGPESIAPSSALPIGAARTLSEMQPTLLDPASSGTRLVNRVLALLAPFNEDENERYDEEILDLPAVGFLVVTSLDIPNKKMTVLAPTQGPIVGGTAITGSFEWTE